MEDEYSGRYRPKKKNPMAKFFPVVGFLLALCLAGIAYVVSKPLNETLMNQVANYPFESADTIQLIVGAVIFLVGMMFIGLIYAAVAPRPTKLATEKQMEKERNEKLREKEMMKRRKREVNRKMAEEVKQRNKSR